VGEDDSGDAVDVVATPPPPLPPPSMDDADKGTSQAYFLGDVVEVIGNGTEVSASAASVRVPSYTCNDTCIVLSRRVQRHL
jgi:hypothetical protein